MSNYTYTSSRDGQTITVPPIDELCLALKDKFLRQEEENNTLKEENRKLKEGIWKEEEVNRLKTRCKELETRFDNGFYLTKDEDSRLKSWEKEHSKVCPYSKMKIGGNRKYIFSYIGGGSMGEVECSCGEKFIFREFDI